MSSVASLDRVLMVNKFHYPRGGAEQYALELGRLLNTHGVRTVEYAMHDPRNLPAATERFFPSHVDFEDPHGFERVRVAGRMLYSRSARRGAAQLLRSIDVQIAHVHNVYHQLSPSVFGALRSRRIPVVMTVHDFKLVCPVYNLMSHGTICDRCVEGGFRHVVRQRCNRGSLSGSALVGIECWLHRSLALYERGVDLFIAPSRFTRDTLVRGGYPASRIRVVPNFVDTDEWAPIDERRGHVAYAGRLSEEKGVDVLLRALAGTDLEAVLIGDGPQRAELERLAGELGVRATFAGHVSRPRVREVLGSASTVVLPSRCVENCPLAVIEAMALGRPVVASRVGGVSDLIVDGEHGLLVEHDDPDALRTALLRLQRDPSRAEAIGAAARRRAIERHTAASHLEAILGVYAEAGAARAASDRSAVVA